MKNPQRPNRTRSGIHLLILAVATALSIASVSARRLPRVDLSPSGCGLAALARLAEIQGVPSPRVTQLLQEKVPAEGFSVADLKNLGARLGLSLFAVQLDKGEAIPTPSIVLIDNNHYVSLLEQADRHYRGFDPATQTASSWESSRLAERITAALVVDTSSLSGDWREVPSERAQALVGRVVQIEDGEPFYNDKGDEDCPSDEFSYVEKCPTCEGEKCPPGTNQDQEGDCGSCSDSQAKGPLGMGVWRVSEPNINLWVTDIPLFYTTSHGDMVTLKLMWKQRGRLDEDHDEGIFGFGEGWECNWRSYGVAPSADANDETNAVVSPNGGRRLPLFRVGSIKVDSGGTTVGTVSYSSGDFDILGRKGGSNSYADTYAGFYEDKDYRFLSSRTDWKGRTTQFLYQTNTFDLELAQVIDSDGKTNIVSYLENTNLITQIENPYGHSAHFSYNEDSQLTKITDMKGLETTFTYEEGNLATMTTEDYGTTTFEYLDGTNFINRPLLITEPDGAKHLYFYRTNSLELNPNDTTNLVSATLDSSEIPKTGTLTNAFETSNLNQRNSFYWGPEQFAALNPSFKSSTNFYDLGVSDYSYARIKHWLYKDESHYLGKSMGMVRYPSPDGSAEGQRIWYDYAGREDNSSPIQGTNAFPRFVARVLPDGHTQFVYTERNEWNKPTNISWPYSWITTNTPVAVTYDVTYETNGVDLLEVTETAGGATTTILSVTNYLGHLPQTITNALEEPYFITYDSTNRQVTSITWPSGLITTNKYFTTGTNVNWLEETSDLELPSTYSSTYSFSYSNGLPSTITTPRGLEVNLAWDELERIETIGVDGVGNYSTLYTNLHVAQTTDPLGRINNYTYSSDWNTHYLVEGAGVLNRTNISEYCQCGPLEDFTDALGQVTTWLRDYNGRVTMVDLPGDLQETFEYDRVGRLEKYTNPDGIQITNVYTTQGLLASSHIGSKLLSSTIYDHRGRPTNIVTRSGVVITQAFDKLNRLTARGWPDEGSEQFGYSSVGLTNYVDPLGVTTELIRDLSGRVMTQNVYNASGTNVLTTRFEYNDAGDLTKLYDGLGHTTEWVYNEFGQVAQKLDNSSNEVFSYGYDALGRLTNRTNALGTVTTYAYDPAGNVSDLVYSDFTNHYSHDALNRLTNMVDRIGITAFGYQGNGLLEFEDGPWADDQIDFDYYDGTTNTLSRRALSVAQPGSASWDQEYSYDVYGRLQDIESPAGLFTYVYGDGVSTNHTTASTLIEGLFLPNGGCIANAFDSVGRLTGTALYDSFDNLINSHGYGYNVGGQRTSQTFFAGNYVNYEYDPLGQLIGAEGKESGGTTNRIHEDFEYEYDAAGNLVNRLRDGFNQAFEVNAFNELTDLTQSGTLTVSGMTTPAATTVTVNSNNAALYTDNTYAEDGVALATSSVVVAASDSLGRGVTNTISVDLEADVDFTYDANGNLTGDGRRIFGYDDEDQLVSVIITDGVSNSTKSEFEYDGLARRRVRKEYEWIGGTWRLTEEVRYIYDGLLVVQERDGYNLPNVTYTRGLDLSGSIQGAGGIGGLLARSDMMGDHAYYHADGGGNITAMVNLASQPVARYSYDPFGNMLGMAGPLADANLYRFSSKEAHPTSGLSYYLYRFYDSNLQRWPNRDPIGEQGGINLYGFVGNNPMGVIDPWGLEIECEGPDKYRYEAVLNHWRNTLPFSCLLRQILRALDDCDDVYTIQAMKPGMKRPQTITKCKAPWKREYGPTRTWIDAEPYHFDNRDWSFRQALAHELLHAHDHLLERGERHYGDGRTAHSDEGWIEDEKIVTDEAEVKLK